MKRRKELTLTCNGSGCWISARSRIGTQSDPLWNPKDGSKGSEQALGLFGCCAIISAGSA